MVKVPKVLKDDMLLRIYANPFNKYPYYRNQMILEKKYTSKILPGNVFDSIKESFIEENSKGEIYLTPYGLYYVENYLLENPFKDGEVMFSLNSPALPLMQIMIGSSKAFGTNEFEIVPLI